MKLRLISAVLLLVMSFAGVVLGGPDNFAAGAGGTSQFNLNSVTRGAFGNPALLGLESAPRAGLSVIPFQVGLWSDEFTLSPSMLLHKYLLEGKIATWLALFLYESFDLWDVKDSTELLSRGLADGMRDGAGLHFGLQVSPAVFSMTGLSAGDLEYGFSAGSRTYLDLDLKLPGGPLLIAFAGEEGLLHGNKLDLSALSVELLAATELAVKFGSPIPSLPSFFDYLPFDRGAYGIGVKYVMGHAYLNVETAGGSNIQYDENDTTGGDYNVDATFNIISAGTGLGKYKDDLDFSVNNISLAAGNGFGFDLGAVFHNDNHFVSVDVRDIGMIVWGKALKADLSLRMDRLGLGNAILDCDGADSIGVCIGEAIVEHIEDSLFVNASYGSHVTALPMSLNLGYTYYYDLSDISLSKWVAKYATASAGLSQQIVIGPGKSYTPTFTLGGAAGLVDGILPLRYGFILGGPQGVSSAVGWGVNTRYVSFDAYYKGIGSVLLGSPKGFEVAGAFTVNWGYGKKGRGGVIGAASRRGDYVFDSDSLYERAIALYRRAEGTVDAAITAYEADSTGASSPAPYMQVPAPMPVPGLAPAPLPVVPAPMPTRPTPATPPRTR